MRFFVPLSEGLTAGTSISASVVPRAKVPAEEKLDEVEEQLLDNTLRRTSMRRVGCCVRRAEDGEVAHERLTVHGDGNKEFRLPEKTGRQHPLPAPVAHPVLAGGAHKSGVYLIDELGGIHFIQNRRRAHSTVPGCVGTPADLRRMSSTPAG